MTIEARSVEIIDQQYADTEFGHPVEAPEYVLVQLRRLAPMRKVNMLIPQLVAFYVDNGGLVENAALWILENPETYVHGIRFGFYQRTAEQEEQP